MSELSLIAVMASMMAAGQNCPLDPQGSSVVRIKPVAFLTETTTNITTNGQPPIGIFEVSAGADFVVELWAQQSFNPYTCESDGTACDPDNLQACGAQPQLCTADEALGLNCVFADVEMNFVGTSMTCNFIDEGNGPGASIFDTLDSGACTLSGTNDPEVDEGGGCTLNTEVGIFPDWVKIRTIHMTANTAGGPFTFQAREATTAVSLTACGNVPTTRILYENWLLTITDPCQNNSDCTDGNACNGLETCVDSVCMPGTPVICLPGQFCDPISGACQDCLVSADCDDGDLCTGDICSGGSCINANIPCNDPGTTCNPNVCNPLTGVCEPQPVVCEDGFPCTVDLCEETTGNCLFCNPITLNLDWRPTSIEDVAVNDIIDLDLFATREDTLIPAFTQGAEVILTFDPTVFELLGAQDINDVCTGGGQPSFCSTAYDWLIEGFPGQAPMNDYFTDGDAFYSMIADLPPPVGTGAAEVIGSRLWLVRFQFRVLQTPSTESFISVADSANSCCRIEVGDSGHATFCPEPAESCCVNLVDIQPQGCAFFGGQVEQLSTSVIWGGPDGGGDGTGGCDVAGELGRVMYYPSPSCSNADDIASCGDTDGDTVSDDLCFWYQCSGGQCDAIERKFADLAGPFGKCPPDGTADGNDRFAALACFSNQDINLPPPAPYSCEPLAPFALNVDAGGAFGQCAPDGVCDGNDAFSVLNAFGGTNTCRCQLDDPMLGVDSCGEGGPAPVFEGGEVGQASLVARADRLVSRPGELVQVEVFLENGLADLRGYQLHLGVRGGDRGDLELIDINVESRKDAVYYEPNWQAYNATTEQMVVGLDSDGIATQPRAYLATFTYRVGPNAAGRFYVDILGDHKDKAQRTFLFPTPASGMIVIEETTPAVIDIIPRADGKSPRKRVTARRSDR